MTVVRPRTDVPLGVDLGGCPGPVVPGRGWGGSHSVMPTRIPMEVIGTCRLTVTERGRRADSVGARNRRYELVPATRHVLSWRTRMAYLRVRDAPLGPVGLPKPEHAFTQVLALMLLCARLADQLRGRHRIRLGHLQRCAVGQGRQCSLQARKDQLGGRPADGRAALGPSRVRCGEREGRARSGARQIPGDAGGADSVAGFAAASEAVRAVW